MQCLFPFKSKRPLEHRKGGLARLESQPLLPCAHAGWRLPPQRAGLQAKRGSCELSLRCFFLEVPLSYSQHKNSLAAGYLAWIAACGLMLSRGVLWWQLLSIAGAGGKEDSTCHESVHQSRLAAASPRAEAWTAPVC